MTRVMHAIIRLQEDFFRYGEGHLRPMILNDVAEIIEMDISTVSRVVNGKYVQTRFGVYELKYFFSEGIRSADGEDVSNKEIKAILEGNHRRGGQGEALVRSAPGGVSRRTGVRDRPPDRHEIPRATRHTRCAPEEGDCGRVM